MTLCRARQYSFRLTGGRRWPPRTSRAARSSRRSHARRRRAQAPGPTRGPFCHIHTVVFCSHRGFPSKREWARTNGSAALVCLNRVRIQQLASSLEPLADGRREPIFDLRPGVREDQCLPVPPLRRGQVGHGGVPAAQVHRKDVASLADEPRVLERGLVGRARRPAPGRNRFFQPGGSSG